MASLLSKINILKHKELQRYGIALVVAVCVISMAFSWFVTELKSSVYHTQMTNMQELANHDITTVQNYLEDEWNFLQNTAAKAALEKPGSDAAVSEFLRKEQVLSSFEDIYLIDEQNHVYSTTRTGTANQELLQAEYLTQERVMSSKDVLGGGSDAVVFSGVRLNGVLVNNHKIVEIVGKLDLNKIQSRIRINNYNGQGYSSVFDKDGTMIIGINASGQHLKNYFTFLEKSTDLGAEGTERIKKEIGKGDSFSATVTEKYSGESFVVSFQRIKGLDWFFIMSVPQSVFDQQNSKMLSLVFTMIAVVLFSIVALLFMLLRYQVKMVKQQEQERQREALEQALDRAEVASRAKTTFLFNMSHDIRTPMNAVLGLSELAKNHMQEPETLQHYLNQISIAGKQLLNIINNILEVSRIESNKVHLNEDVEDTEEILDGIETVFMNQSRAKHLNIHFEREITNRYLYLDRTHVEEVWNNIISNAIKYTMDDGTVDISCRELPASDAEHVVLRFEVRDTGIGMSEEYQTKLFQQFERERNSTVSGIQGTGLGLSIVKRLVDLMQGTIEVQSKKDVGTTIVVETTHRIGEAPVTEEQSQAETENIMEGKRVLLAEDNEINAMIAEELLSMQGIVVERAETGLEAVNMLKAKEAGYYGLILMDIQMPVMDGYQATIEIRNLEDKDKARTTILAMTANAFEEDRQKAFASGMNGHLGKPIDVPKLMSALTGVFTLKKYQVDHSELNAFRDRYHALGCTCGYFIYRNDAEQKLVYADAHTAEIYGCSSEEEFMKHTGGSFLGMVHPEDMVSIQKTIELQQHESQDNIDNIEYRILRKDGAVRRVRDIGYKAHNGQDDLFYVYITDVTDLE